jgi:hypothetical protein
VKKTFSSMLSAMGNEQPMHRLRRRQFGTRFCRCIARMARQLVQSV